MDQLQEVDAAQLAALSADVLNRPDIPYERRDEYFQVDSAGMNWDVAGWLYEPHAAHVLCGSDGKAVGALLLHGGGGDHRFLDNLASILAGKLGIKTLTLTYPGHWYFDSDDHEWPGEPLDDGTGRPRLPIWDRRDPIGHGEYDLVTSAEDPVLRANGGTAFFLAARPGTQFYRRQAAWPLAYETAYLDACARNFPEDEFSLYLHGHSTGGPQAHMLLQRMGNVRGLIGMETSSFGIIKKKMDPPGAGGEQFPFNYLTMRTWRDTARYMGTESGDMAKRHLPLLMEQVFEAWKLRGGDPGFKSEQFIQFAGEEALTAAAHAVADDQGYEPDARKALVERYLSYTKPLPVPGNPPVPPLLYIINEGSRDHRLDNYTSVLLPTLQTFEPVPKAQVYYLRAGVHNYNKATPDLPRGVAAVGAKIWFDAITSGYYDR